MKNLNKNSPFFIGMALFSMFFGSGNLTFPLYIGQVSKDLWQIAAIGFSISAVLLPFLGFFAILLNNGCYNSFFKIISKHGKLLIPVFLTAWIPLGSGPRCITVAYASLKIFYPQIPLILFSLVFCIFVFVIIYKKQRLLKILGYFLTPLLLISLLTLIIAGIFQKPDVCVSSKISHPFVKGLFEGYNTMDLIASCFFAASIVKMIDENSSSNRIKIAFKSSIVGIIILEIVYLSMIFLSAAYSNSLENLGKEKMLFSLSKLLLIPKFSIISSIIVFLACATTFAALIIVYADYLKNFSCLKFFKKNQRANIFSFILCYFISLMGFEKIGLMIEPILKILYPILIILVFANISKSVFFKRLKSSKKME